MKKSQLLITVTARWSLWWRLTITAALGAAFVLAGTAITVFFIARNRMIDDFDRTWRARGEAVTSVIEYNGQDWDTDERSEILAAFSESTPAAVYQIWAGERLLVQSPTLAGRQMSRPLVTSPDVPRWETMPDGRPGRRQAWDFIPEQSNHGTATIPATMVLLAATTELSHAIARIGWILAWTTPLGSIIAALLMARIASQLIRPLDELRVILAERTTDMTQPVTLSNPPQELTPVIDQLNQSFQRIAGTLAREREFTSDAAHELRTPLAALQLLLEVSLHENESVDARRRDCVDAHALTLRLQRIVDGLLALARLDRNLIQPRITSVAVSELVRDAWSDVNAAALARRITCIFTGFDGIHISTDPYLLRQVMVNICDNAVSHGDAGAVVTLTATAHAAGLTVIIRNEATDAPMDLSSAGQPLWRADQARQDTGLHLGIGLSLCQRIMQVLGGKVELVRERTSVKVALQLPARIASTSDQAGASESGVSPS